MVCRATVPRKLRNSPHCSWLHISPTRKRGTENAFPSLTLTVSPPTGSRLGFSKKRSFLLKTRFLGLQYSYPPVHPSHLECVPMHRVVSLRCFVVVAFCPLLLSRVRSSIRRRPNRRGGRCGTTFGHWGWKERADRHRGSPKETVLDA